MATPTPKDYLSVKKQLQKHQKKLNTDGSPKREMDDNKAKALFRSAVRKEWMYCPTKLSFLLENREPDLTSSRRKWFYYCKKCNEKFGLSDVEVDHKKGEIEFVEWEQALDYAEGILNVSHDDLQILCIPDHKTKTRAEALGLNWECEKDWNITLKEQEFTRIVKSKAKGQRDFITSNGLVPAANEELRKRQIREVLGL